MEDKIKITSLESLRFKQVKLWKVLFEYDNKEYLLLDTGDVEEGCITLFERHKVRENRYILKFMKSIFTSSKPIDYIKDISKRNAKTLVYSNIDREYFVKQLVRNGLAEEGSLYYVVWNAIIQEEDKINAQIRELNRQKSELYKEWSKTAGRGSRVNIDKIKKEVADRIPGAKDGDYCEEYKDYYGNTHPEYGGKLVDLYGLKVGTVVFVTNGGYLATITFDDHGDKCVVTDKSLVKLTKEHHSAYVDLEK